MGLTENRTWTVTCKRGLVEQCKGDHVVSATDEMRSTAAVEKFLREEGWTLHEDGATCPVCMGAWDGSIVIEKQGRVRMREVDAGGGSRADVLLKAEE